MKHTVLKGISQIITAKGDELLENLRELVAIESIEGTPSPGKPFGEAVNSTLEQVLELGRNMGLKAYNQQGYVGIIEWGTGDEVIGVLSHVDVVPPGDVSSWDTPPFQMVERDGYLCGRGVVDDKGPLLSALYGMYALKQLGVNPRKRVRLIIGTNEETGWGCIKYYLANNDIPDASFCPDGMFTVVNREKGIISVTFSKELPTAISGELSISGGEAVNLVPAKAKAIISASSERQIEILEKVIQLQPVKDDRTFLVEKNDDGALMIVCKGKSAHAMTPEKGSNAIIGLLNLICSSDCITDKMKSELSVILRLIGETTDGSSMGLECSDELSGALTMNLGKIQLNNGKLTLQLDIRTPVTSSVDNIFEQIKSQFQKNGYSPEDQNVKKPLYVRDDSQLIKTLCDVYELVTGEKAELHSIGGGTYARAFPNCVCFGSVYPQEKLTVHSPNEQTLTSNVMQNVKMYGLAIYELIK